MDFENNEIMFSEVITDQTSGGPGYSFNTQVVYPEINELPVLNDGRCCYREPVITTRRSGGMLDNATYLFLILIFVMIFFSGGRIGRIGGYCGGEWYGG